MAISRASQSKQMTGGKKKKKKKKEETPKGFKAVQKSIEKTGKSKDAAARIEAVFGVLVAYQNNIWFLSGPNSKKPAATLLMWLIMLTV